MLRIFVGGTDEHRLPFELLRSSIERHASTAVEVQLIGDHPVVGEVPKEWAARVPTSFSLQRFLIPAACGYAGRAVYLDSDQIVLGDVAELAAVRFEGASVLTTGGWQSAVMVLDCAALENWRIVEMCEHLDHKDYSYSQLSNLKFMPRESVRGGLDQEWNVHDGLTSERGRPAKLVHYTDMGRQPWLRDGHPAAGPWLDEFGRRLSDEGWRWTEFVASEIRKGHVRPSLASLCGLESPAGADAGFVFPDRKRKRHA